MTQDPKSLLRPMSGHINLLPVEYQLISGFVCQRTGLGNDTRSDKGKYGPKIAPLLDVSACEPLASKIPAFFGLCVPTHRTSRE